MKEEDVITDKAIHESIKVRKTVIIRLQGTLKIFHDASKVSGWTGRPDSPYAKELAARAKRGEAAMQKRSNQDGSLVAVNTILKMRQRIKKEKRMLRVLKRRRTKWL